MVESYVVDEAELKRLEEALSSFSSKELRMELRRRQSLIEDKKISVGPPPAQYWHLEGTVVSVGEYAQNYTNYKILLTSAPEEIMSDLYEHEKIKGVPARLACQSRFTRETAPCVGDTVIARCRITKDWKYHWREKVKITKIK